VSFLETPRFPERLAFGASGGPGFDTSVTVVASGREARNALWAYPRHAWDVSQGIKTQADFEALLSFFMVCRGRLYGWRFKDWGDFQATHSTGVVTGLTSTTFQLFKRYTSGGTTIDRIIQKPVTGSLEIKVSGVTTGHTVDATTGIVTIGSAPSAANVTWSGDFDVPMRFDTDRLDRSIIARNASTGLLHEWGSIPVVEVRV
jgi:uncharacterized protein (TIGR02217 family)